MQLDIHHLSFSLKVMALDGGTQSVSGIHIRGENRRSSKGIMATARCKRIEEPLMNWSLGWPIYIEKQRARCARRPRQGVSRKEPEGQSYSISNSDQGANI